MLWFPFKSPILEGSQTVSAQNACPSPLLWTVFQMPVRFQNLCSGLLVCHIWVLPQSLSETWLVVHTEFILLCWLWSALWIVHSGDPPRPSYTDLKNSTLQLPFLILTQSLAGKEWDAAFLLLVGVVQRWSKVCHWAALQCQARGVLSLLVLVPGGDGGQGSIHNLSQTQWQGWAGVAFFTVFTWNRLDVVIWVLLFRVTLFSFIWLVKPGFCCTEAQIHTRQKEN